MKITCQKLADLVGGRLVGDPELEIAGPAKIEEAGPGEISFLANPKYLPFLAQCRAAVLVVDHEIDISSLGHLSLIRVEDPYQAFGVILNAFVRERRYPAALHPQSCVDPEANLGQGVGIGAFSVVGRGAHIGDGTLIASQVYIAPHVRIGRDCILHPGVRVMDECEIGDRCILYPNAVIGSDGFGYAPDKEQVYSKIPQTGKVILGHDVEVGANAAVDRATMGATVVGDGCKIDNMVHVAHNVEIGPHSVLAAQTGISGSTKIGEKCVFGGQVGVAGHLTVAPGTQVGGQTGITHSIEEPDRKWNGTPVMPYMDNQRSNALFRKLPQLENDFTQQIKKLQEALEELSRIHRD